MSTKTESNQTDWPSATLQIDPDTFDAAGRIGEEGEPAGVRFVQLFPMPEAVANPIGLNVIGCGRHAGVVSFSLTPAAARELARFILAHVPE